MIYSEGKREQLPGKDERLMGSVVFKYGVGEARNETEEGRIHAEECQEGGVRSVE